jgi:FKBP-type peptidyl-prolyl cis-trans isomerase FkpA
MRSVFYILCVCVAFVVSCDDNSLAISAETQLAIDLDKIDTFLAENGITAQQHESGLRYVVHQPGTGVKAGPDKCIEVSFLLRLLGESDIFDEEAGFRVPLNNQLILGWRIGLKELGKGGSMTLYVPSGLAYGPSGRRTADKTIPANQCLVFDIELTNLATYNTAGAYCESWP